MLSALMVAVLVVCGLGRVEAFAKLPNGDGEASATGNAGTLRRAVSDWIAAGGASSSAVVATYGPIEDWDVSEVTNMKNVFDGYQLASTFGSFNADLSKWNTSAASNMHASKYTHSRVISSDHNFHTFCYLLHHIFCSVSFRICVQSGRVQMEYGGGDKYA